ncbi:sulfite exporter TauE/SafE family protein [Arenibaculum sp.]|uniref:sulfite exporter TauE/SafE family protein n=1 Tax=Arenibaculum sp. TaxID=2865862 RepID=UPI002E0F377A|nr:sulfite exporter TauE/SafE family protein [Arenibaculum sp.]
MIPEMMADLPAWKGFDPGTAGAAVAVVLAAAVLRGFAGFGFAIAAVPLLSLVMPPGEAVPLAVALQLCGGLTDLPRHGRRCHWPSLRWLIAGASIGSPAGVLALASFPAGVARLAISAVCALAIAALALGFSLRAPPLGRTAALVGLTAGVFNGLAAMPGPPVVAYYMASALRPETVRASLLVFFAATSAAAAASLLAAGLLEPGLVPLTLAGFPAMLAGTWLGERLFAGAAGRAHRTVSLVLLAAVAVASGAKAILEIAGGP